MAASRHRTEDPASRTLGRELDMIRDAVAMVASGGSRRIVLGGLHFGEQLLEPARRMAADKGARIVPLWTADEAGLDIAVERDTDG